MARGWCLALTDGREFSYSDLDGVRTADEARLRLMASEPTAEIVRVDEEEIVAQFPVGHGAN